MKQIISLTDICLYLCCLFTTGCYSAKILGVSWYPAESHQAMFQPIWKELSLRGHQVKIITTKPMRDKALTNLTEIDVSFLFEKQKKSEMLGNISEDNWFWKTFFYIKFILEDLADAMLDNKEVKALLNSDDNFDVVIVEAYSTTVFAFGERFKAPVIALASCDVGLEIYDIFSNPTHPLISPDVFMAVDSTPKDHPFFFRCKTFLHNILGRMLNYWYFQPKNDKTVRKYFGNHIPYLDEICQKYSSLLIRNVNLVTHNVRANLPNVIDISQIHIRKSHPLPKDLQDFLDSSTNGVVYFSLGVHVPSSALDKKVINEIITTFSELPYNVLWKWEVDTLPKIPSNVLIKKFFPQQDLLAHPNIKVFVTQGGMQSIEEAISREVPMVGIPFLADQPSNIRKLVDLGMAIKVKSTEITKKSLKEAILEVAGNKRYKDAIKKYKRILEDQPLKGVDKAVWWIEHVIRHKGAEHFRSPASELKFYEYFMLDVIAFLFIVIILVLYFMYKLIILSRYSLYSKQKTD